MKKILITGKSSYIGLALAAWLARWPDAYEADLLSLRDGTWQAKDFSSYDAVVHVAGIAHQPGASTEQHKQINQDLAIAVAEKAQRDGVRQFVFMSTMAVYGMTDTMKGKNEITEGTVPQPVTSYGISKYAAENAILALSAGTDFSVCVVRAPMVYGPNCPGNYSRLRRLPLSFPFVPSLIPALENERSAIYIDHLCACLRLVLDSNHEGVVCPRDREAFCTAQVLGWIAEAQGRSSRKSAFLGAGCRTLAHLFPLFAKVFGNLSYAEDLFGFPCTAYNQHSLQEAIQVTEADWR